MSEFDAESERCPECDGHFRHFAPCSMYTGEPGLPLEARVAMYADIYAALSLDGHGTVGCEAHDGECADNWRQGEEALPMWQDDDFTIMNDNEADDYRDEG